MQQGTAQKTPPPLPADTRDARRWALFLHLAGLCHYICLIPGAGVILPLVLWSVKKEDSPYIDEHGKEAVNFQISILIYFAVSVALCFAIIGFVLVPAVLLFQLVTCIIAAARANNGELMRYPLTIQFFT